MIFDGTYLDKKTKEALEEEVGPPFGFVARFRKASGIGSHRMIIDRASKGFTEILKRATGTVYGNVEMRPKGIIVHLNVKNTRYSWSVPYFRLVLYRTEYFSIHCGGEFISFRKDHLVSKNKTFLDRLMRQRNQYMDQFKSPID